MKWLLTLWGAVLFNGTVIEIYNVYFVLAGFLILGILFLCFWLGRCLKR